MSSETPRPRDTSSRLAALEALLADLSDEELAKAWARCMRAMRDRGLVRTANTPVGDYAERVCCSRFNLHRAGFSEKSIDAIDERGVRFQIKGRRLTPENRSRQLGAIRDVADGPFDVLLAVFFDEDLDVEEIWSIPCEVVKEAAYVARTNSTRFVLTQARQLDPRVKRLA
jgi:hypothetical protein